MAETTKAEERAQAKVEAATQAAVEEQLEEELHRETGEAKDENHCPRHPDQLLEVADTTSYGSTIFEQCPKCRSEDTKAEKAAAKEEAEREKGTST